MKIKIMNAAKLEAEAAAAKPNSDFDITTDETKRVIKSFYISDRASGMSRKTENTTLRQQKSHGKEKSMTSKQMNTSDFCWNKLGCNSQPSARKLASTLWRARFSNAEIIHNRRRGHNLSPAQYCTADMEGATKWDTCLDLSEEENESFTVNSGRQEDPCMTKMLSSLQYELRLAKTRIRELETESHQLRKKTERFVRKVTEEEALWRSRKQEKTRAAITTLRSDLKRERKAGRKLDLSNSKLAAELSSAKLSMKQLAQDYEKEKKGKEMMEEVCDELAREIGDDKAEMEAVKRDSMRLHEEVEEERKMVQMAELWREEQVQMKLADARVILHHKYDRVSQLIQNMESFLNSRSLSSAEEAWEAELLLRTASSLTTLQSTNEFSYDPPTTTEMLSALHHACLDHPAETDVQPSHPHPTPAAPRADRVLPTTARSTKEADGRTGPAGLNTSGRGSLSKKGGSLSRLWRTGQRDGGRLSSSSTTSVDRSCVENARVGSPAELLTDSGEENRNRVMKGCLEWPCNAHRSSSSSSTKLKLLRMGADIHKVQQIKHVH